MSRVTTALSTLINLFVPSKVTLDIQTPHLCVLVVSF